MTAVFYKWFNSLVARAIAVLVLAVLVSHGLSMGLYHVELVDQQIEAQEAQLAEKLVAIRDLVDAAPEESREAISHAIGGSSIEAHWHRQSAVLISSAGDERLRAAAERLIDRMPGTRPEDLRISYGHDTDPNVGPHFLLVSLRMTDGSWVNATAGVHQAPDGGLTSAIVSTILMAIAVIASCSGRRSHERNCLNDFDGDCRRASWRLAAWIGDPTLEGFLEGGRAPWQ
ncbi:hypothetical protein [Sphingomonas daechungensis]|uniref:hypothetical protein n=1 Tax=Sphingomonas daechungensis TaxID=1176646 RepID=UPI0037831966